MTPFKVKSNAVISGQPPPRTGGSYRRFWHKPRPQGSREIPDPKSQIPNKSQNSKFQLPAPVAFIRRLELGIFLGFGIWDLGFRFHPGSPTLRTARATC